MWFLKTMLINICIVYSVSLVVNSYIVNILTKQLIPAFHYIKIKSLNTHGFFRGGIAIAKAHNLFHAGGHDVAETGDLCERSSSLNQVLEVVRVRWMRPQEEGTAGVKAGRRKTTWVLEGTRRQVMAGSMNEDAHRGVVRQGLHPAAAKWLILTTLTPISFATSCFSFSYYWKQFCIAFVHVCMGTIHICGLFESCLSSWPSGLCLIMIFTLYSSPDIWQVWNRNCKDEHGKKICLAYGPNWISQWVLNQVPVKRSSLQAGWWDADTCFGAVQTNTRGCPAASWCLHSVLWTTALRHPCVLQYTLCTHILKTNQTGCQQACFDLAGVY